MAEGEERKSKWADLRDLFAATREAMIVAAMVLLIIAPSFVKSQLERAGISSFAGVEFGIEDVFDASEQVAVAEAEVAKLSEQLASVQAKLDLMTSTGRSARPEEIRELASAVSSLKTHAKSVDHSLSKTTSKIGRVIDLMPPEQLRALSKQNANRADEKDLSLDETALEEPPIQAAQLLGFPIPPSLSQPLSR
ncbi:hypothetical protein [Rhodopirellula sp. MGV]|uniref:hypothetical protein n=1 Tax=Rhodopirellula sp. MGV TaxID=2023130 RepID=UPI000B971BEF|nr:hypothetical protein [Rhodopirellula sp. MGV]OYP37618.1 hypothetical protein CGZ80_04710 [Rhodopirellula sp. MGV]PNY34937.1 hypothetical protein C2E31_20755 [Rhodopirellula baltica]